MKRPNFGLAATTALSGGPSLDSISFAAKPFDGFKTGQNQARKPFDLKGAKSGPSTEFGGGQMSVAALEKNLVNDIQQLDWEFGNQPSYQQKDDTKSKPKLFMKKKDLNGTGETKATDGDWDGFDTKVQTSTKKPSHPTQSGSTNAAPAAQGVAAQKQKIVVKETSDWDLGDDYAPKYQTGSKNQGGKSHIKKMASQV